MKLVQRIYYWIEKKFGPYRRPFKYKIVEEFPDKLKKRTVYIERLDGEDYEARFMCPFNCQETIQINLDNDCKPNWWYSVENNITIHPSIWMREGCRCHYFLKNGKIKTV